MNWTENNQIDMQRKKCYVGDHFKVKLHIRGFPWGNRLKLEKQGHHDKKVMNFLFE